MENVALTILAGSEFAPIQLPIVFKGFLALLPTCTQEEGFSPGLTAVTHPVCTFHLGSSAAWGGVEAYPWHIPNPSYPATQCPLPMPVLSLLPAKQDCLGVLGRAVHLHTARSLSLGWCYLQSQRNCTFSMKQCTWRGWSGDIFMLHPYKYDFMRSQTDWCWFEQSCEVERKANLHSLH